MKQSTRQGMYPKPLPMLKKNDTENRMPAVRANPFFDRNHPRMLNTRARNDVIKKGICKTKPIAVPISWPSCSASDPVGVADSRLEKLEHTMKNQIKAMIILTRSTVSRFLMNALRLD